MLLHCGFIHTPTQLNMSTNTEENTSTPDSDSDSMPMEFHAINDDLFYKAFDGAAESIDKLIPNHDEPMPLAIAAGFMTGTIGLVFASYGKDIAMRLLENTQQNVEVFDRLEEGRKS